MKESKNKLTREMCQVELYRFVKGDLVRDFFILAVCLLICLPVLIGAVYLFGVSVLLGLGCFVAGAIWPVWIVCQIIRHGMALRRVANGGFSLVKDTVSYLSKGEMPRSRSEGGHAVDAIYFARYGRFVSGGVTFAMTSGGDEFYLVILHGKKDRVVFAYHSMMYECKECDA